MSNDSFECVEVILNYVNLDICARVRTSIQNTALLLSIDKIRSLDIIRLLVEHCRKLINISDAFNECSITKAIQHPNNALEIVKMLVKTTHKYDLPIIDTG